MKDTVIAICNRIIEYSFYSIFLFVPLAFTATTSELFEFNKMWLTFGITLVIAASWFSKMVVQKKFFLQKTPLDIPIALFLLAHILSTLFSIDQHISFWGYYTRFNGGLLSMVTYIFLYYAFVSNFFLHIPRSEKDQPMQPPKSVSDQAYRIIVTKHALFISLGSGLIAGLLVALWGFPSHFGYDPTCYLFRGTFDVSCWTDAFQPKVRIFSTLGQPNWMAAYLSILLPLTLSLSILNLESFFKHKEKNYELRITNYEKNKKIILASLFMILASLFYVDILYTKSQSGFLGTLAALGIFSLLYLFVGYIRESMKTKLKILASIVAIYAVLTFVIGHPIPQLNRFTLDAVQRNFMSGSTTSMVEKASVPQAGTALEGGSGGTSSGTIRQNVWQGAIDAWKDNPLFGTGVETFAFAYYTYRPVAHNLTSEWDYLYNKAHNEYLNYLTTTGLFGLSAYLLMIGVSIFFAGKALKNHAALPRMHVLLIMGLLCGYISVLVSNFFGFSVVILNIYLFMIPAFLFLLANQLIPGKSSLTLLTKLSLSTPPKPTTSINSIQWISILVICCLALLQIWTLINFWYADQAFALAQNYNRIAQYDQGAKKIREAITLRGDEPVFIEELATSDAAIAVALAQQKQEDVSKQLSNEAIERITTLTTTYPHNINFLKSQVRVYYTLSELNPAYLGNALITMKKLQILAPTDAKISYNLGVLYGQNGQTKNGIETLQKTIQLKPDYREAYFALGLFYHDLALDPKTNRIINAEMQEKAVEQMNYILTHFNKNDKIVLDTLKSWGE